jgi:hypothetical protein
VPPATLLDYYSWTINMMNSEMIEGVEKRRLRT